MTEKLPARLTLDIPEADLQKFIDAYKDTVTVRRHIIKCLTKLIESSIIQEESEAFYHDSNASVKVAFNGGYRKGLKDAISLLTPFIK